MVTAMIAVFCACAYWNIITLKIWEKQKKTTKKQTNHELWFIFAKKKITNKLIDMRSKSAKYKFSNSTFNSNKLIL